MSQRPPDECETRPLAPEESGDYGLETRSLGSSTPGAADIRTATDIGGRIGRYLPIEELGHGGMGRVLRAYDPKLQREVALKALKGEAIDARARARMVREARTMARLSHPNVVAVYDVEDDPRHGVVLAMELVKGTTLRRWLRERPRDWNEILGAFIAAGRGLAAAHGEGLLHRDFKPDNVLVALDGRDGVQVKVTDFGLAKLGHADTGPESAPAGPLDGLDHASASETLTEAGVVMGTPVYMAPEQHRGGPLTSAADQYAFCVALWEALHGERPFEGSTLPKVSSKLRIGSLRSTPRGGPVPSWLRRACRRGLSFEPQDRWPSMSALLGALTKGRSRARVRKRLAAGGVLAALGAGAAAWWSASEPALGEDPCAAVDGAMVAAWGPAQRVAIERAFRRDPTAYSEQTLVDVEAALDRYAAQWVEERQAACVAGQQAGTEAAHDAGLQAVCLDQLLRRFDALARLLGDADRPMVVKALGAVQALPDPAHCRDAKGWRRSRPVPDDPAAQEEVEALRMRMAEVEALSDTGRLQDAVALAETLLAEARTLDFPSVAAETLLLAGGGKIQIGDYAGALPLVEEGILLARTHGLEQVEARFSSSLVFLHTVYTRQFELAAWQSRVHEVLVERLGNVPRDEALVLVNRGRLERQRGHLDQGIELHRRAVELYEQDGKDAPGLVVAYDNLASSYVTAERFDEAASVIERAEALATTALGPGHPHRANLLAHAARIARARGDHADAAAKLEAVLELFEAAYGDDHPNIAAVSNGLGLELEELGRPAEAIAAFERAITVAQRVLGPEHRQVATLKSNLGLVLRYTGRAQEALALHQAAHAIIERTEGEPEPRYQIRESIADDLRALGRCEEAEAEYRAALAMREAANGSSGPGLAYVLVGMGLCALHGGQEARARELLESALQQPGEAGDDEWSNQVLALARFSLAMALRDQDPRSERAVLLADQARSYWAGHAGRYATLLGQCDAWLVGGPSVMPQY